MPATDSAALYAAFKARDARFDGHFFVGVSSTGIYCRPVCRARRPKEKNCAFYRTAAEAEQAGYRPCLLCRPELAPGSSRTDAVALLARRAARLLEENCGSEMNLNELAGRLGCTDRHLRRVFTAEFHVSPVQYLQTCRLLLAKNLLTDTNLSILEIAMAAGFGSLRRFNDLFKKRYRMPPGTLRKGLPEEKRQNDGITLALGCRPPYRFEELLNFLASRAIKGVENVNGGEYRRTVQLLNANRKPVYGWLKVSRAPSKNAKNDLSVTVSETLLPVLPQVLGRVRHLFDLYCDPAAICETLKSMNEIRPGLWTPGIRLPGCFDAFETAVRAILGQQITVKAAGTLTARLVQAYGAPVRTGIEGLTHIFPAPETVLALEGPIETHLGPLGVIAARAGAIRDLAGLFARGEIDLSPGSDVEAETRKLTAIPGIGNWTARYIAMRVMGWPDIFLETDAGVKKALESNSPGQLLELAERWRPWRSYATISLWNSLQPEKKKI
ncbi:MAG: helix-turn-helix domain-containing protein [Synergistaceae bacterium]|jgi:AraC family transcriptional regulator of adaptative response / DNA-3-methyladenine glycosylase II|nr:helix-turn-helix domain-containing protein [Synergistaceae bacterium]